MLSICCDGCEESKTCGWNVDGIAYFGPMLMSQPSNGLGHRVHYFYYFRDIQNT